jgi:hypothetical protein
MTAKGSADPVRRYLIERGVRADLVHEGLAGLVDRWTRIVHEVARGYPLTLDDYLNDMDIRDIIAGALVVASQKERQAIRQTLEDADETLRSVTTPSPSLLRPQSPQNRQNPENPQNLENPENLQNLENPSIPHPPWWYSRLPARFSRS